MNKNEANLLTIVVKNKETSFTRKELADKFRVSSVTISNYLRDIVDFLTANNLTSLFELSGNNIRFTGTEDDSDNINKLLSTNSFYEYRLEKEERLFIITTILLTEDNYVTLNRLSEILFFNKITIASDMKDVLDWLKNQSSALDDNKYRGYKVNFREATRRHALYELIKTRLGLSSKELFQNNSNICANFLSNTLNISLDYQKISVALSIVQQHFNIIIREETIYDVILFVIICFSRIKKGHTIHGYTPKYENTDELYRISRKLFDLLIENSTINDSEVWFLVDYLKEQNLLIENDYEEIDQFVDFNIVVKSFLYKISNSLHVNLINDSILQDFLTTHIMILDKRIKSGDTLTNPYREQMISQYPEEYRIIQNNIYIIEEALDSTISDDELVYIMMHVIASMERIRLENPLPKVIIVCHAGVGTSYFLTENIKSNFRLEIVEVSSAYTIQMNIMQDPDSYKGKCDFIISTVPLINPPAPTVVVNPLLNKEDITNIYDIINATSHDHSYQSLSLPKSTDSINTAVSSSQEDTSNYRKFSDLLSEKKILLDTGVNSWQESLIVAGEPLLWGGNIKPEYLEALIQNVNENGPYFVFIPGVALAHAHPRNGALSLGGTFMRCKDGVTFGHKTNDPVKIVICLSIVEGKESIIMLKELINALCDNETLSKLLTAKTADEIIDIFRNSNS